MLIKNKWNDIIWDIFQVSKSHMVSSEEENVYIYLYLKKKFYH